MPTPRNNNNAGIPNRLPALPTNTLKNSKQAMMSMVLFAVISIIKQKRLYEKSSLLYKDTEHASYMQIWALFRNYVMCQQSYSSQKLSLCLTFAKISAAVFVFSK
jgi:hypothetical protein